MESIRGANRRCLFNRDKSLRNCLIIFILFIVSFGFSQSKKPARQYSSADTALIRNYIKRGTALASNNNDSAMYLADEAIQASQQIKNEPFLANAFYLKAKVHYFTSNFSAAQFYQYKSLVLAQKLGEK